MAVLANIKPKFWDHSDVELGPYKHLVNFRKLWKLTVVLTLAVALIPLLIITLVDYRVGQTAIESEILLRTTRLVSNTRRSVSFFLAEHRAALDFVVLDNTFESLILPGRVDQVLQNLKNGFGGFVDVGVINDAGIQVAYSGPYDLQGKKYQNADWFKKVAASGVYLSDVFMGYRNTPHMVIAAKHDLPEGGFYVLRATLDTARFNDLLSGLAVGGQGDAFVINQQGTLQTPSRYRGKVLDQIDLPIPSFSERSQVEISKGLDHSRLVIGYAYIPETQFVLMIVKECQRLMAPWKQSRLRLLSFLIISVFAIVFVVLGGITYLVNQIYLADQRRLFAYHKIEYANKMASIGRLSAGVAHEINNPLAIINEKAGLIKDLFMYKADYANDPKLIGLINSVISSVERCAGITRRLLNFSRNSDMKLKSVDLKQTICDVLGFMGKETEYRSIRVNVTVSDKVPTFESDLGLLQEIFLNLITNAFTAMEDGGLFEITADVEDSEWIAIRFADDGYGIPEGDLERVFEPFFSTKLGKGGTGLGLSITYGLVRELGGRIGVESTVGRGTTFTVRLPLVPPQKSMKAAKRNPSIQQTIIKPSNIGEHNS